MKYYKRYDDKLYSFDEAYDLIEKNELKYVVMRVSNKWANPSQVEVNWDMINKQKKDISIPVWAVKSDRWELWSPDYEKQQLADDIGDWIEDDLEFELDSRFFDSSNMSISDWWQQLDSYILIEDDYLAIMQWLRENHRLDNWKERNKKYFNKE